MSLFANKLLKEKPILQTILLQINDLPSKPLFCVYLDFSNMSSNFRIFIHEFELHMPVIFYYFLLHKSTPGPTGLLLGHTIDRDTLWSVGMRRKWGQQQEGHSRTWRVPRDRLFFCHPFLWASCEPLSLILAHSMAQLLLNHVVGNIQSRLMLLWLSLLWVLVWKSPRILVPVGRNEPYPILLWVFKVHHKKWEVLATRADFCFYLDLTYKGGKWIFHFIYKKKISTTVHSISFDWMAIKVESYLYKYGKAHFIQDDHFYTI